VADEATPAGSAGSSRRRRLRMKNWPGKMDKSRCRTECKKVAPLHSSSKWMNQTIDVLFDERQVQ